VTRARRRAFVRTTLGFTTQFVVPLALAQALVRPAPGGPAVVIAMAALLAAYIAYIVLVGRWTPRATLLVPLACLLAIPIGLARLGTADQGSGDLLATALAGAIAIFFSLRAWQGLRGRAALPGAAIEIGPPLGPGRYLVAQGGSRTVLNAHLACLGAPHLRGQSFGLDIVGLTGAGMTAPAFRRAADAPDYAIFGREVRAPVDGVVIHVTDGLPDLPPPATDPERPMGNHVWLETAGPGGRVLILLAHLRSGSISIEAGAAIRRGQKIAQVGNSGNTSEPHLHIHAQAPPRRSTDPLAAEPVPICFRGLGQLHRGQRFALD
jgi:hypothetical protein